MDSLGHIDWLLYKSGASVRLRPIACEVVTNKKPDGGFPSDHHAVVTTFAMGEGRSAGACFARGMKRPSSEVDAPTTASSERRQFHWTCSFDTKHGLNPYPGH